MNVRQFRWVGVVACMAALSFVSFAQQAPGGGVVATVGGRPITRAQYDLASDDLVGASKDQPVEMQDAMRRQRLEALIRLNLLVLEAQRLGLRATRAEAESALKQDSYFNPGGRFDEVRWQQARLTQGARFDTALAQVSQQVAGRRLGERMRQQFAPPSGELRERATRQLRRVAVAELSLASRDFSGDYPEPREADIVRYYRERGEEFRKPDRASLSVVFVNEPARTQRELTDPAAGEAWNRRMRVAADSLIAAVKAGATLEDASAAYGGPRSGTSVLPDNFPGYWSGSPEVTASVFRARPGALLSAPVPGKEGFLVVRVDEVTPSYIPSLSTVARTIRTRLREDSRLNHEERERRQLYAQLGDSLRTPAWVVRWAVFDTATVVVSEPSAADLERWYRGHLADFSSFEARTGTIRARPLSEVIDIVRQRWKRDERRFAARSRAEQLYNAWAKGQRPASLETQSLVRTTPPMPRGTSPDSTVLGRQFADSLWSAGEPSGAVLKAFPRGFLVWTLERRVADHRPTFEQVSGLLGQRLDRERQQTELAGARALYDRAPERYGLGKRYYFTRMTVPQPPIQDIPLKRWEVERWHRQNLEKYSAPELVRTKHILIEPLAATPAADRAARVRADSLLARLRAGEDFDLLAANYSDDPATKDKGGDLGVFKRGTMLEPFEDAAFRMRAGDLVGPVRTEVGYHILLCTEYTEAYVQPLSLVYSMVASDLARVRSDSLAGLRADSLARVLRTISQAKDYATRSGFRVEHNVVSEGQKLNAERLKGYFTELFQTSPGRLIPRKEVAKGEGYWITWVDSIGAPVAPVWEEAKSRALQDYRSGAGERAMTAKVAEMDSLAGQGWSLDSLAVLWGGLSASREMTAAGAKGKESLPAALDSLVFTDMGRRPALSTGQTSGWVRWGGGLTRVRLLAETPPSPDRLTARVRELERIAVERRSREFYDGLRKRFPVRILDRRLATIPLPEMPPEE